MSEDEEIDIEDEDETSDEQNWHASDAKQATEMLLLLLKRYHKRHDVAGIDDVKIKETSR